MPMRHGLQKNGWLGCHKNSISLCLHSTSLIQIASMTTFARVGFLFFAVLFFAIGLAIFLGDQVNLLQICGRGCKTTKALIYILGNNTAKFLVASVWICMGIVATFSAVTAKDDE